MKLILATSEAKQFDYLMKGDEVVVRNYKKILAFFTVHFADHPVGVREVLALPEFSGPKADEKIQWSTELFESTPVKLSSLTGEKRSHYQAILQETLDDVRDMVAVLPEGVSSLLQRAVSYHSDDTVYCAEDKVVITEWGMFPKGSPNFHTLSLNGAKPPRFGPWAKDAFVADAEPLVAEETPAEESILDVPQETGYAVGYMPQSVEPPEKEEAQPQEEVPPVKEPPVVPNTEGEKKKKKRWWLWLLLLIPLLLLLLLMRKCDEDGTKPLPPVSHDDIVIGNDSVTKVVNNQLLLIFEDNFTPEDFIRDFRALYPDKKKYPIYVPDQLLPRVELGCPPEELNTLMELLPQQFEKYGIMVLPVTVFSQDGHFSDPAFGDKLQSWYFNMINVEDAWNYTEGSSDVVVAVIDDGFDLKHPELKKKVVDAYNAVEHNTNVYPAPEYDEKGNVLHNPGRHGTHVAATAVGMANNKEGNCGIAPGCKLMAIQVANENGIMTSKAVMDGVLYAIKKNADVINMSLGCAFDSIILSLSESEQRSFIRSYDLEGQKVWTKIFNMGFRKNIAIVKAGGNENQLIGMDPRNRIQGVVNVSAVQPDKVKADFSNYGELSTLSAPGVEIYNAVPGGYASLKGTSMASPIVAGAIALMKSQFPNMKVSEIVEILQRTGTPSPSRVGPIINLGAAMKQGKNPGNPTQPVDPSNPVDPSQPIYPGQPGNPNQPVYPGQPGYPVYPGNPNQPVYPSLPVLPGIGQPPLIPGDPGTGDCDDCDEARRLYEQLLRQIDNLRKQFPGCIGVADTLVIPIGGITLEQLTGRWMSTTPVYNTEEKAVVLYFTFNGTSVGKIELVEPDGKVYEAPLSVSISGDRIDIHQTQPAESKDGDKYNPYNFTIKPDKNRKADGMAVNQMNAANMLRFSLVRIK